MSGRATLATDRLRLPPAAPAIEVASPTPAFCGLSLSPVMARWLAPSTDLPRPLPLAIARQLQASDHAAVHLVRSVGQAQRARGSPRPGKREVVGEAAAAVQLNRHVHDALSHVRGRDLDL